MNKVKIFSRAPMWMMAIVASSMVAGCGGSGSGSSGSSLGTTGSVCTGANCVDLGSAANYAVFANTGIATDANASVITGNIAAGPGVTSTAITGFALSLPAASPFSTTPQVSGKVYAYDYAPPTPTEVNTASLAMGAAYTAAAALATSGGGATEACPNGGAMSDLGNTLFLAGSLPAGVYTCGATNITIPDTLTLNGSATDVWVFKTGGTLGLTAAKQILLTGGALAKNVFWQVGGAVTVGSTAQFKGIILGQTAITFGNSSSIDGRLYAQTAVTLDHTTVTQP